MKEGTKFFCSMCTILTQVPPVYPSEGEDPDIGQGHGCGYTSYRSPKITDYPWSLTLSDCCLKTFTVMYDHALFYAYKSVAINMGSQPGDNRWPLNLPPEFVWVRMG